LGRRWTRRHQRALDALDALDPDDAVDVVVEAANARLGVLDGLRAWAIENADPRA
jgi:hypothetical protein